MQGDTTRTDNPWDKWPLCRGKRRATLSEVQCCEEQLSNKMFYMVMFLPTPPILSDTLSSRDPCVPTVGRYHVLTVILVDGAFSKDSRCTAACAIYSYFSNTHSMPNMGWAQEGSPSQGGHTWLWSVGKWGGQRGMCFPAPHHQHKSQPWTCQCEHLHWILMLAFQIRVLPMKEIIYSYIIKSLFFHIKSTYHENHCS